MKSFLLWLYFVFVLASVCNTAAAVNSVTPTPSPDAQRAEFQSFFDHGHDLVKAGKYDEAIAAFQDAAKKADAAGRKDFHGKMCFGIGWAYFRAKNYPKSREASEQALKLNPQLTEAHALLGATLYRLQLYKDASPELKAGIDYEPYKWATLLTLGEIYFQSNQPEEALKYLREADASHPNDPNVLMRLGFALLGTNQYVEAETALKRSIDLKPSAEAYEGYGLTFFSEYKDTKAIDTLRQGAKLFPDDAIVRLDLGMVLSYCGTPEQAEAELKRSIQLEPHFEAYLFYTQVLITTNRFSEAREVLNEAAKLKPESVEVVQYRAILLAFERIPAKLSEGKFFNETEEDRTAIDALRKAIDATPDSRKTLFLKEALGMMLAITDQYEEAAPLLRASVKGEQGSGGNFEMPVLMLAFVECQLGDYREGIEQFEQLIVESKHSGNAAAQAAGLIGIEEIAEN